MGAFIVALAITLSLLCISIIETVREKVRQTQLNSNEDDDDYG